MKLSSASISSRGSATSRPSLPLRGHSGTLAQVSDLSPIARRRHNPAVSRPRLKLELDFPATYEIEQRDRIDRSGGRRAYGFPDAVSIDPQQDVAAGPILGVTPEAQACQGMLFAPNGGAMMVTGTWRGGTVPNWTPPQHVPPELPNGDGGNACVAPDGTLHDIGPFTAGSRCPRSS